MKLSELHEGMMKRSDPYISGEREKPTPAVPIKAPAISSNTRFQDRIRALAKKTGVSHSEMETAYHDLKRGIDMALPNAYAMLMGKLKRKYQLESLQEEKEFNDDENGSLVYGWKSVKELNAEEGKGYVPAGYTKILELGGIYANETGKGQGDKLMKHFLSSPMAQEAELIFLDPVPGLGRNFHYEKSEEQQVADLKRFYARYGFRSNPKAQRMWLVKKGEIPTNKLPT